MDERITEENLPRLAANTALIDMDGTLTPTEDLGDYLVKVLYEMVAQKRSLSGSEAEKLVRSVFIPSEEPITSAYLDALQINFDEYWQALMCWQKEHFSAFEDAVEMIRSLQAMDVRMYPATTNSSLACRAKLAVAGLADQFSCTYFTELFGGSEVCPEGKSSPEFFRALLEKTRCQAGDVVVIGDKLDADFQYAREAGIEQVVIVRRDQPQQWTRDPGGPVFVKSLMLVPKMLEPRW